MIAHMPHAQHDPFLALAPIWATASALKKGLDR